MTAKVQLQDVKSGKLYPCVSFVGDDADETWQLGDVDTGIDSDRQRATVATLTGLPDDCTPCALQTRCTSRCACANLAATGALRRVSPVLCNAQQASVRAADKAAAKAAKEALTSEQQNLADQNASLVEDLETITTLSTNVIAIDEQNKQLNEDRDALLQEIKDLNELTDALSDDRAQEWFLRGAGTVLVGLLFGFWLGRRIYNKRSTSGWA